MSLDLDAIRAREATATPGPWKVLREVEGVENTTIRTVAGWFEAYGRRQYGIRFIAQLAEGNPTEADAEFIAAARHDIPALLAEVDQLRAALVEADLVISSMRLAIDESDAEEPTR